MLSTANPPKRVQKTKTIHVKGNDSKGNSNQKSVDLSQQSNLAFETIDWDSIITEDDTPVENYTTEQQYPLLTTTLYDSWSHSVHGKRFIAVADVGVFSTPSHPPIVPDIFLSLGLLRPDDRSHKRHRSYFVWEVGKPPEVAIEIVSNEEGNELDGKMRRYAEIGVLYYAVFDPLHILSSDSLRLFKLTDGHYSEIAERWMPEIELGFALWQGEFQGNFGEWLRWCKQDGTLIPTGSERAIQETARAEYEAARAERLAAQLRRLGLSEENLSDN